MDRCPICHHTIVNDSCSFCQTKPVRTQPSLPLMEDFEATTIQGIGLKYDAGKLRFSLIPPIALNALAKVLTFGAIKYASNSWQTVPNGQERYLDALYRHLEAYRSGESIDPESGLTHLSHAITNIAFLLHFEQYQPKES